MISSLEQAVVECFPNVELIKVNSCSVVFKWVVRGELKQVKISQSYKPKSNGRTSMSSYTACYLTLYVDGKYWASKEASSYNLEYTIPSFVRSLI